MPLPTPSQPLVASEDLLEEPGALAERYQRDGYVLFRGQIPLQLVAGVRAELTERLRSLKAIVEVEGEAVWSGLPASDIDGDGLHAGDPAFCQLAESAPVRDLLEAVFGEPMHVYRSVNIRYSLPADRRHVIPSHQDAMYISPFKGFSAFWIPLVDIPEGTGGLAVAPGSHRSGLLTHSISSEFEYCYMGDNQPHRCVDLADVPGQWATAALASGDVLVFDAYLVHSGLLNSSKRIRRSIDGRCEPTRIGQINWQARLRVLEAAVRRRQILQVAAELRIGGSRAEEIVGGILRSGADVTEAEVSKRLTAQV
jgi:1-deoxypentalenic acid 11beta-hydroxylase